MSERKLTPEEQRTHAIYVLAAYSAAEALALARGDFDIALLNAGEVSHRVQRAVLEITQHMIESTRNDAAGQVLMNNMIADFEKEKTQ